MLDFHVYPHIVEQIIDCAIADTLAHRTRAEYALRLVSRWAAERVDRALFAHIEIEFFSDCINVEGKGRRPLPGFRLRQYTAMPRYEADRDLDAVPSPLRLLRHARVVDFRGPIWVDDGERLFAPLREDEVTVVRIQWADFADYAVPELPLRCAKFVTGVAYDVQGVGALGAELLAGGARVIAVTFVLPSDVVADRDWMRVEGAMEGCEEVVVRYVPAEWSVDSVEPSEGGGLGVLHGFVGPMVARAGSLKLTLVGAEDFDQALFGYAGPFDAAKLKDHILDTIYGNGTRSAGLEAAVSVVTNEERRREIGGQAFELEAYVGL